MTDVQTRLEKIISSDPTEKKNIGTFTAIHKNPFVYQYLFHYLNKNVIDRSGYRSLSIFEKGIETFFKGTFDNKNGSIILTSGSTESILLAFHYAREKARDEKAITKPNILIPKQAHYSLKRCATMLNIEVRDIEMNKEFTADINDAKQKIDENTILVCGILISTELGVIDDLAALNDLAKQYNTGLHVDAAIGGFIVPFLETDLPYKFSQLSNLFSVNVSCHKFGLSLCGGGVLLLRDKRITQKYTGSIDYLSSGSKKMAGLTVTGSALGLFSMYTNIALYKSKGYKTFAKKYLKTKNELADILEAFGYECFLGSPYAPHIFVSGEDINKLSEYLTAKGWIQHVYKVKGLNKEGLRIVVKKDQEAMLLNEFVADVREFKLLNNKKLFFAYNNYSRVWNR